MYFTDKKNLNPNKILAEDSERNRDLSFRVEQALTDIRNGKMVILVDDEDRENEGDLIMAADKVTPDAINFMATFGRGLICVTLTEEQIAKLDLTMMQRPGRSGPPLGTAFTVSVEARTGVTTGISAADRSHTIRVASNPNSKPDDLVTPGHVFPLRARNGGVLVRAGQTEGSVDLARLAGLTPAAVICEIMNDDGTMARMTDLEKFSKKHHIQILTIADLIHYRLQSECFIQERVRKPILLDITKTEWLAIGYRSSVDDREFLALVKGKIDSQKPVLVRVHKGSIIGDLFSSTHLKSAHSHPDTETQLVKCILEIEKEGAGVIVYIPGKGNLLDELGDPSVDKVQHPDSLPLREFGLGAQILHVLGVRKLKLMTRNLKKVAGIHGFGLELIDKD